MLLKTKVPKGICFLSSYLKSGAKKHEDFARILMEVLLAPVLQKSEDEDEDE